MGTNGSDSATTADHRTLEAIAEADALAAQGEHVAAIELLSELNRRSPARLVEQRLVYLRYEAFYAIDHTGPEAWPPPLDDQFAGTVGIPEISGSELTVDAVTCGIQQHGALLVRGLIPPARAADLRAGIDQSFAAAEAREGGAYSDDIARWFQMFNPVGGEALRAGGGRRFVRRGGGVWTADSPRMLFDLIDFLGEVGFVDLVNTYFGERGAISVKKSTLRIVPPDTDTNWHQDGSFLGQDIRSLNLWLALSDCGVDAPGLDVVPRRFPDVLETGTRGALFDWSAGHALVEEAAGDAGILRPEFAPGDALLFDHLLMHRTGVGEGMTKSRYAIESWFFASSCYPPGQVPLLI